MMRHFSHWTAARADYFVRNVQSRSRALQTSEFGGPGSQQGSLRGYLAIAVLMNVIRHSAVKCNCGRTSESARVYDARRRTIESMSRSRKTLPGSNSAHSSRDAGNDVRTASYLPTCVTLQPLRARCSSTHHPVASRRRCSVSAIPASRSCRCLEERR